MGARREDPVKLVIDLEWLDGLRDRFVKDRTWILIIFLFAMLVYLFGRGVSFGLERGSTDRVRFHAIPVAMAPLYHGFPHDYTSRKQLALTFQDTKMPIDSKIQFVRTMPGVDKEGEKYYWAADDRGMADFVILAFKMFGPKETSLYKFYFVFLGVALLLYVLAYKSQPELLGLAAFILLGIAAYQAILPLVDEATFLHIVESSARASPVGLFEPRIFDVLAMISVFHIALFATRATEINARALVLLGLQVLLFVFCYHARSSLGWQLLAMILIASAALTIAMVRRTPADSKAGKSLRIKRALLPLLFLVSGVGLLSAYKHSMYDQAYFGESGSRTFWHNALMGMGTVSREFRLENGVYEVAHDDRLIVESVLKFMRNERGLELPSNWTTQLALESLGGHNSFDWNFYEQEAKNLYFAIWRKHTRKLIRLYAWQKPLRAINTIFHAIVIKPGGKPLDRAREERGLKFAPFSSPLIFLALVPMLFAGRALSNVPEVWATTAVLLAASFIPAVAFYSSTLTQGGMFVLLAVLVYLIVPVLFSWLARRYFSDLPCTGAAS